MKKIILFILLLSATSLTAQEKLSFSKVIQAEDIDKNTIYDGVREWFSLNFVSGKSVIDMDDRDAGIIIGNSNRPFSKGAFTYAAYSGWLNYTIKVQCRDGRYRVELTNFRHEVKKGNAADCELGILTTSENYTEKGMAKRYHNNVWKDLKKLAEDISFDIFDRLEKIDFSNTSNTEEDW